MKNQVETVSEKKVFVPGKPGGSRAGIPNKMTRKVNDVLNRWGDAYLRRLMVSAMLELDNHKENLKGNVWQENKQGVKIQRVSQLTATTLVNTLIMKRLPVLKSIKLDESRTLRIVSAVLKLEGEDALAFLGSGAVDALPGSDAEPE